MLIHTFLPSFGYQVHCECVGTVSVHGNGRAVRWVWRRAFYSSSSRARPASGQRPPPPSAAQLERALACQRSSSGTEVWQRRNSSIELSQIERYHKQQWFFAILQDVPCEQSANCGRSFASVRPRLGLTRSLVSKKFSHQICRKIPLCSIPIWFSHLYSICLWIIFEYWRVQGQMTRPFPFYKINLKIKSRFKWYQHKAFLTRFPTNYTKLRCCSKHSLFY